jgi:hypothetical protein
MTKIKEHDVIQTSWGVSSGFPGMATLFRLDDGNLYAAPMVSDYARKSLTWKEARYLVSSGKAIRTEESVRL